MSLDTLCILGESWYEKFPDISTTLPPESGAQAGVAPPRLRGLEKASPTLMLQNWPWACYAPTLPTGHPAALRTEVPGGSRNAMILRSGIQGHAVALEAHRARHRCHCLLWTLPSGDLDLQQTH